MKTFLHILVGFILGVVCTLGVLAIIAATTHADTQEQFEMPISYFDAKTKKGKVKLHAGMPKDSVLLLAGEPDEFRSTTIQGHNMEHAGYKISNRYVADLEFTFIDGILTDFSQD